MNVGEHMKTSTYSIKEFLCIIASIIMTIKILCDYSEIIFIPDFLDKIIVITYIFIFLIILFCQRYTKKELVIELILGILCAYSSIIRKDYYLLISYMSILMIKNVDLKKIMAVGIRTKVLFISFHFILFIICFLFDKKSLITNIRLGEEHTRYTIFLTQPNAAAMLAMWTIFELIYIKYKTLSLKKLIGYFFILLPFIIFTNSRTCIYLIFIVFMLIILEKKGIKIQKKIVNNISKYGFAIISLLIGILTIWYIQLILYFPNLSKMFTGRIYYSYKTYTMYGWTMFGQWFQTKDLNWDTYSITNILLDSLYSNLFLGIGVIFIIIISISFYNVSKNSDYITQLIILAFIIYSISEGYAINTYVSSTILIVANYYLNLHKNNKLKEIRGKK